MDRKNAQMAKALGPDDELTVTDLAEGLRLVRLLTPEALDLESRRMRHCVGHGGYDDGICDGGIEIYSLRDPQGRPVLTIAIDVEETHLDRNGHLANEPRVSRAVSQIQGKRNGSPDPDHIDILRPFAKAAGW